MAQVSHIGFASSRKLAARLLDRFRKSWVTHAVFILDDETLGALVLHPEPSGPLVSTLADFERDHTLIGVIQPKVPIGPTLTAVMDERRGARKFGACSELVCEVIRRSGYPGSFGLKESEATAQGLYDFLRRPVPVSRDAVRLFSSSAGGVTPPKREE